MSKRHHTPIAFHPDLDTSIFNDPLGELDTAIDALLDGTALWTVQATTPDAPATFSLYPKADGVYWQDSAGIETHLAGNSERIVAFTELGALAARITLSAIPQTYKHLWLRLRLRDDGGAGTNFHLLQFNGDTVAANYCSSFFRSSLINNVAGGQNGVFGISAAGGGSAAGLFSAVDILVYDYASTTRYKHLSLSGGAALDSGSTTLFGGGVWLNAAAITQIVVEGDSTLNFVAGSGYELWGIL